MLLVKPLTTHVMLRAFFFFFFKLKLNSKQFEGWTLYRFTTRVLLVLDSPERTSLECHFIHLTRGLIHFMTQLTEKRDKKKKKKKRKHKIIGII